MKKFIIVFGIISSILAFNWERESSLNELEIDKDTPVWEVLTSLGEKAPNHTVNTDVKGVSAEKGKDLFLYGITQAPSGRMTKKQSKHFVCTSCHNVEIEDPVLNNPDPQSRLDYAAKKGIPFLQGTTMRGAVNRTTFYNDDYQKKYGDLVAPARNNLREAIQLCAVECSQGRPLKTWELESVLAYLWTLELKMGDLNLEEKDFAQWKKEKAKKDDQAVVDELKGLYSHKSPAHFTEPPHDLNKGYELTGNPDNGKHIYELSCMHCHENKRYSYLHLDDTRQTAKYLKANFDNRAHSSMYMVARHGTPPLMGKRAYMPHYPLERMSNQQVEDLRAYIEMRAK